MQVLPEHDQLSSFDKDKVDSKPSQVSAPTTITVVNSHQHVEINLPPTEFQSIIINNIFRPLKLPSTLHPYPPTFFKYLPRFSGEDLVMAEKHLRAFENFIDNFEMVHQDVVLRLFSKSLVGDAALWFENLGAGSICSWAELYDFFLRY